MIRKIKHQKCHKNLARGDRRRGARLGAVAVEFAVVAPMLLSIVVGLIELSRVYDAQNMLEASAREGARFAAMDRNDMDLNGLSANQKMEQDVKNFLTSSGIPASDIQVTIRDAENPTSGFDLDDPANDLRLFEVQVDVPYSSVSYTPVSPSDDYGLSASVTFRNGRATISQ